jgi:hypothetical protein
VGRVDYYDDPDAPKANSLVPAASAIVTDEDGRILLHRRRDNDMWALPGGVMEIGESLGECVVREVCKTPCQRSAEAKLRGQVAQAANAPSLSLQAPNPPQPIHRCGFGG